MFDSIVSRVRSFLGTSANVEPQREPRIIPKEVHGIDPELVAWQAKRCCEALQRRGYRAYIVGGAVRDLLLGVAPKDFDVATDATPEEVKRAQKRAIIIGRRFRLVHVIFGQEIIECSTFRALEGAGVRKDSSGRVISDNVFGEMWEDAARRDFTINALYYDPATEEIYDYHHGFEDLGKKRLRMIGNPEERYREDPVRMIRAVRISAKLGFAIEPATERPIARMAKLLSNVPSARLVDEALKLLTCGHAVECVSRLRKEGLAEAVLPTLNRLLATPDGEAFLMLALRRTDERLAIGKRISPFSFSRRCSGLRYDCAGSITKRCGDCLGWLHSTTQPSKCSKRNLIRSRFSVVFRATCMTCGFCRRVLKDVQASLPILLSIIRATARATIFCFCARRWERCLRRFRRGGIILCRPTATNALKW